MTGGIGVIERGIADIRITIQVLWIVKVRNDRIRLQEVVDIRRTRARKVVRLERYSNSTPSRRNGSKATAYGGGSLLLQGTSTRILGERIRLL